MKFEPIMKIDSMTTSVWSSPEIDQIHQKIEDLIKVLRNKEEALIKDVLKKVLDREPTLEDARKCNRGIFRGDPNKYLFSYRGVTLGTMNRFGYRADFDRPHKMKVWFQPSEGFPEAQRLALGI